MSAIPNDSIRAEPGQELVGQDDDGMVEVGTVSETQGGYLGGSLDTGGFGWREGR